MGCFLLFDNKESIDINNYGTEEIIKTNFVYVLRIQKNMIKENGKRNVIRLLHKTHRLSISTIMYAQTSTSVILKIQTVKHYKIRANN